MPYDPVDRTFHEPTSNHPAYRPDLVLNIFHLDPDVDRCAESHVDTHVGKLFIEVCQMLSTAVRHVATQSGGDLGHLAGDIYQSSHVNHPMNIWVRESYSNWYWSLLLALALSKEYTYRFFKIHGTHYNCLNGLLHPQVNAMMAEVVTLKESTPFPLCMPDHYKFYDDPYWCYRAYYKFGKSNLHYWTRRQPPSWLNDIPSRKSLYGV